MPVEMMTRCCRSRANRSAGQQVSQGLTGAGAGLYDQVPLVIQRGFYRRRHLLLAFAMFKVQR